MESDISLTSRIESVHANGRTPYHSFYMLFVDPLHRSFKKILWGIRSLELEVATRDHPI